MSEGANLTYYQRSRDVILNTAKDYNENEKERLREQGRDKKTFFHPLLLNETNFKFEELLVLVFSK